MEFGAPEMEFAAQKMEFGSPEMQFGREKMEFGTPEIEFGSHLDTLFPMLDGPRVAVFPGRQGVAVFGTHRPYEAVARESSSPMADSRPSMHAEKLSAVSL